MAKSKGTRPWGTTANLKKLIKEYVKKSKSNPDSPRTKFLEEELLKLGNYIGGLPSGAGKSAEAWASLVAKKAEKSHDIEEHEKVIEAIGGDVDRFKLLKNTIDRVGKEYGIEPIYSSGARTKLHKIKTKPHQVGALDISTLMNEDGNEETTKSYRTRNPEKSAGMLKDIMEAMTKDFDKSVYLINEEDKLNHLHLQSIDAETAEARGFLAVRSKSNGKVYSLGNNTDKYLALAPERDIPLIEWASKKSPELRIKVVNEAKKMKPSEKSLKLKQALGIATFNDVP